MSARPPHHFSGFTVITVAAVSFSFLISLAFFSASSAVTGGSRNIGRFARPLTVMTAEIGGMNDARNAGPMMHEGFVDLLTARIPTAVTGISWIELVLMARNV